MKLSHWIGFILIAIAAYWFGAHKPTMLPIIGTGGSAQ